MYIGVPSLTKYTPTAAAAATNTWTNPNKMLVLTFNGETGLTGQGLFSKDSIISPVPSQMFRNLLMDKEQLPVLGSR